MGPVTGGDKASLDVSAILANARVSADASIFNVQVFANALRDMLQRIHGGRWRIQIEHEEGLVLIARRGDRDITAPRPEVS